MEAAKGLGIRCSRTFPCISCSSAKANCEFRDGNYKRPPVSREYAESLEKHVATLEALIARAKAAPNDERNAILDEFSLADHQPPPAACASRNEASLSESMAKASLQETTEGSMIYHVPTSIFHDEELSEEAPPSALPNEEPGIQEADSDLLRPLVRLCIGLFFFWQYPTFMFIDREAFVQEFERNPSHGQFCSRPLVYAACAIGALMSSDASIRAASRGFAESAQSIITSTGLDRPRIRSVQALLCCGYYEVGQGNLSKGWMFSGMAFRMGQDAGFQHDPAHWDTRRKTAMLYANFDFNDEFRRRVYWGCFLSDKIFSLFLRRPTFMRESDGYVDISEPLPLDPLVWENWLFSHGLDFLKTMRPAGPKLTLLFNRQVELGRIIHAMLSDTFAPKPKQQDRKPRDWTEISLNRLNSRLVAWHEALPVDMRWKKWFTSQDVLQPNVSVLHTLYHITRICLNLPFIPTSNASSRSTSASPSSNPGKPEPSPYLSEAIKICASSAEALVEILERFRSQHTLGNAPIMFVHGAIVAFKATIATLQHKQATLPFFENSRIIAVDAALSDMSPSWGLAKQAREKFRKMLGKDDEAKQASGPSARDAEADGSETIGRTTTTRGGSDMQVGLTLGQINFASRGTPLWDPTFGTDSTMGYWDNVTDDFWADADSMANGNVFGLGDFI